MTRAREKSDLPEVARKAGEQGGFCRCGACGAKGRGQGECGSAQHGPDAEPGSRVTGAGPHTRSRHQKQTGQADGASASHQHRCPAREFFRSEEVRGAGCRRDEVGRVRGEAGREPSGSPPSCPHGSVLSATIAPDVHTEGGWQTTTARHRELGGQDRQGRGSCDPDADL